MKSLKAVAPVVGVFCVALFVRLLYNLTVGQGYHPIYDAYLYHQIAWNMLTEHCYCYHSFHPTVSRSPLWPFIMAGIYAVTGWNAWYAQLFYCLTGSGTCVLIYLLARDLFGKRIGLVAGLLAALYTGLFIYDGWLMTESLYTFLLTSFAYSIYQLQKSLTLYKRFEGVRGIKGFWQRYTWAIVSGIVLGLMTLARPNGVGFLVLLAIWAVFMVRAYALPWRLVCKNAVLLACIAGCIVAPWTIRNYRVAHSFVLVATGMGEVLRGSYNDNVLHGANLGLWSPPKGSVIHDQVAYTPKDDSADTAKALTWIRTHLSSMPYLLGLHLANMWEPYSYTFEYQAFPMGEFPNRLSSQIVWLLIPIQYVPMLLMAVAGLWLTLKKHWKQLAVVYLVLAFTIAENVVFYGNMRFRAPIEPLLVLFAGGFLWWVAQAIVNARKKHTLQAVEAA